MNILFTQRSGRGHSIPLPSKKSTQTRVGNFTTQSVTPGIIKKGLEMECIRVIRESYGYVYDGEAQVTPSAWLFHCRTWTKIIGPA